MGERPDWFVDARSGERAPADIYAVAVPYRDEAAIGNIKYIWDAVAAAPPSRCWPRHIV